MDSKSFLYLASKERVIPKFALEESTTKYTK